MKSNNIQQKLWLGISFVAILGWLFISQLESQIPDTYTAFSTNESLAKEKIPAKFAAIPSNENTTASSTLAPSNSSSFAIVELFTSQGCSSCPPADHVLRDLIEEAEKTNKPIYGLSFHVDYWNYLGWKDPYSSADYSNRQREYNRSLKSRGSYTPQMIVNGVSEFIGSKRSLAYQEVDNALEMQSKVAVEITNSQLSASADELVVSYKNTGTCSNCQINIALVESDLRDAVKRGENHGRTLRHDNVVRAFTTQDFKSSGKATLDIPSDVNQTKAKVIVYVQKGGYGQIVGATQLEL